jgi:hypothetical protein
MWAGVLAYQLKFPKYQKVGQQNLGDTKLLQIFQKHGPSSMEYIATARLAVVLIVTFSMLAGLYFAWRLFGSAVAILAFLLIAFDPFYVAHSRFLHTIGMPTLCLYPPVFTTCAPLARLAVSGSVQAERYCIPGLLTSDSNISLVLME